LLELLLADHASVSQVGQPGDLVRGAATVRAHHILNVSTHRCVSLLLNGVFAHLVTAGDQVDENPEVGQNDDEDRPPAWW
jgi:hypothetical protein